jgi:outer membrane protein
MRKTITAGAFGGLLFAMVTGAVMMPQQDELLLGFIDSQAVIGAYPGTAEAQATFTAENDAWQRQANAMQEEINQLNQELERQSMAMTQERRAQLTAELQQKAMDYQTFIDEIWGQTGRAYQRNQELMRPIIDKVNALLERVGQEDGYDYIFDAASGGIVWADPAYDLTPRIIELMGTGESEDAP